jgi:hypothetical protein
MAGSPPLHVGEWLGFPSPVTRGLGMANKKLITDMKFDLEEVTCL